MGATPHDPPVHGGTPGLERFDYSRIGTHWAVVRLVARLREDIGLQGTPALIIDLRDGTDPIHERARACVTDRRLRQTGTGAGALLWRGAFAVPVELAEHPGAAFMLRDGDDVLMALPAPVLRTITARSLRVQPPAPARPTALTAIAARRRALAVATVAALTTTSSPAAALAATVTQTGTGHSRSTTATTTLGSVKATPAPATATATTTATPTTIAATTAVTTATPTAAPAATPTATPAATSSATPAATTTTTATTTATPAATTTATTPTTTPTTTTPAVPTVATTAPTSAVSKREARRAAAAAGATAAHDAAGQRQRATARRIAILNAGIRQTAGREQAAAHAEHARHRVATQTAATSEAHTKTASSTTAVKLLSTTPGDGGPTSWTGVVPAQSSLTGAVRNLSGLLSDGNRPPSFLIPIYMEAGRRYHVPWEVLAAINAIESDYGRDLNTSSAGAIGWMQFEPSTWKRYGVAADGVSEANPYDPRDAIFAAAHYLQAAGGSTDIRRAVFAYNHAGWYVDEVLQRAAAISQHVQYQRATVSRRGAISVDFDTDLKTHPRVRYSSGTLSHYDRLIAAANMVSAAGFRYQWGGGHEQPSRFGPFDCSGSVSYVMQQAGYPVGTTVAADIGAWKLPSGPGRVTIFYDATHTFMRIDGRFFGTSGFARPGGGAGWFDVDRLPTGYLANFREVHVPDLGTNSFSADAALALARAPLTPRARQAARERSAVSAFDEARVGALASQAVADHQMVHDLVAHGLHLLRPTPAR